MQVVEVTVLPHNLGDHVLRRPLRTINHSQLFKIVQSSFSDCEDLVFKPRQTDGVQFLIKEGLINLSGQNRELFNN